MFHFDTILKWGSELKSCLSTKRSYSWGEGSWSFTFLKKLRQCCSFRGNYANSCAYKLVFVHENCLEFIASHILPSQAEFLVSFLGFFFSDSLKKDSLWWCFTVLVNTTGPVFVSQPCLGVYATTDHLNLIGTKVIMLHLFGTFKYCCAVSYPSHAALCSIARPGWDSCSQVKLLSTPKKPVCFTWTGCKWSFVTLFSLWEKSQVEKALLKIWQRVGVNRIWKQELFQRETNLGRKTSKVRWV